MAFCNYNCGTGFNSSIEREEHEENCNFNLDGVVKRLELTQFQAQQLTLEISRLKRIIETHNEIQFLKDELR